MLTVRPYVASDFEAVSHVWDACGLSRPWNDHAADIAFCTASPASDLLVGERDGRLVATVMVGHDGHRGVVYYLGVLPDERGRGYGRDMMAHAEAWLRERGVAKLNLMLRAENEATCAFYESLGYVREPRVVMARRLDSDRSAIA